MAAAVRGRGRQREQEAEDQEKGDRDRRRFGVELEEGEKEEKDGGERASVREKTRASLESLLLQQRRSQRRRPLMILVESVPVQTGMSDFWRIPPRVCAPTHSSTCACSSDAELRL